VRAFALTMEHYSRSFSLVPESEDTLLDALLREQSQIERGWASMRTVIYSTKCLHW
jgi:hypothetical protein